jgi:hypothetical protein
VQDRTERREKAIKKYLADARDAKLHRLWLSRVPVTNPADNQPAADNHPAADNQPAPDDQPAEGQFDLVSVPFDNNGSDSPPSRQSSALEILQRAVEREDSGIWMIYALDDLCAHGYEGSESV